MVIACIVSFIAGELCGILIISLCMAGRERDREK